MDVPVVRGRDDYGIDVLLEDFTVVQVGRRQALGTFFDGIAVGRINVAYGHDLIRADLIRSIKKLFRAAAGADYSDAKHVVSAEDAG